MAASETPLLPPDATREEVCAFFRLDDAACARLALHVDELRRWNARMNLVAPSTMPQVWTRHVADGLQLLAHLPRDARQVIDLGSGSGVPGLVLALAAPERARFTLVESNHRKAAFLRQVAQQAGIAINMMAARIEALDAAALAVDNQTVLVARALAPLPRLLALAEPFWQAGARALLLKGREAAREMEEARKAGWQFDSRAYRSMTDHEGQVLLLQEVRRG